MRGDDTTLVADEVRRLVAELSGGDAMAVEDLSGDNVTAAAMPTPARRRRGGRFR